MVAHVPVPVIVLDSDDEDETGDISGATEESPSLTSSPLLDLAIPNCPETLHSLSSLPAPRLRLDVREGAGLELALDIVVDSKVSQLAKLELFSLLVSVKEGETPAEATPTKMRQWFKMSDINPSALPVVIELRNVHIEPGVAYFFTARAVDRERKYTEFCELVYVFSSGGQG